MMTVTAQSGRTFVVAFMHSSPLTNPDGTLRTRPAENAGAARQQLDGDAIQLQRRLTICDVAELSQAVGGTDQQYTGIGFGVSMCHPGDVFVKKTGRKKSLTYALEAASRDGQLSRDERADIWTAYFAVFGR